MRGSGWHNESHRHRLAGMGIKTARGSYDGIEFPDRDILDHPFFEMYKSATPHMNEPKYYEEYKAQKLKIVYMTVREYEEALRLGFWKDGGDYKKDIVELRERIKPDSLEFQKHTMLRGEKTFPPSLFYRMDGGTSKTVQRESGSFNQEGHHRAVASEEMGEEIIPVAIIYPPEKYQYIIEKYMTPHIRGELYG